MVTSAQPVRAIKPLAVAALLAVLVMALLLSFYTISVNKVYQQVDQEWTDYSEIPAQKGFLLSSLRQQIGYGGFIHNFKNYVLRGREEYHQLAQSQHAEALSIVEKYWQLPVTDSEMLDLQLIEATLNDYLKQLSVAADMVSQGKSPFEVDQVVKVSDVDMINALDDLEKHWLELNVTGRDQLNNTLTQAQGVSNYVLGSLLILIVLSVGLFFWAIRLNKVLFESVEKLRASEVRFREMVNHSADAVIGLDEQGRILLFSPAACHMFGYKEEEVRGRGAEILLQHAAQHKHHLLQEMLSHFETKEYGEPETVPARRKDGQEFPLELNISSYSLEGKIRYIAIARDISIRRKVHDSLLKAKMEAESALDTRRRFFANVSHELRTPLNAIIGFSDIIDKELHGQVTPPKYREYAEDIKTAGTHLLSIITDILDFSKIEEGRFDLQLKRCDIREDLKQAISLLHLKASSKQIEIREHLPDFPIWLDCDCVRLKQVFVNIIGNAVKFTPNGGHIEVRAQVVEGRYVEIEIEDNGVGVRADQLEAVLNPYEQVTNIATPTSEGTGLGVPLSKHLVELHGGEFIFSSQFAEGTCVTIRLPYQHHIIDLDREAG
ncbi:PAS domain-containing sensor histidine kinase [Sneathiella limimaris]|uniref:PAS domain-containing sensor histidine kinase n=1 Tax=Sneathiella limimaris TaxID=1964213 RepID=UPI00146BFBE8|nr:PAS domain-containing sensor histidine kinase [Sneathiella limimaris]